MFIIYIIHGLLYKKVYIYKYAYNVFNIYYIRIGLYHICSQRGLYSIFDKYFDFKLRRDQRKSVI